MRVAPTIEASAGSGVVDVSPTGDRLTLSPLEVVESVTIVVPGLSRSTTVVKNAISRFRLMASPLLSTTPDRSTSVSRTTPRSAPTLWTASMVGAIASGSCKCLEQGTGRSLAGLRSVGELHWLQRAGNSTRLTLTENLDGIRIYDTIKTRQHTMPGWGPRDR